MSPVLALRAAVLLFAAAAFAWLALARHGHATRGMRLVWAGLAVTAAVDAVGHLVLTVWQPPLPVVVIFTEAWMMAGAAATAGLLLHLVQLVEEKATNEEAAAVFGLAVFFVQGLTTLRSAPQGAYLADLGVRYDLPDAARAKVLPLVLLAAYGIPLLLGFSEAAMAMTTPGPGQRERYLAASAVVLWSGAMVCGVCAIELGNAPLAVTALAGAALAPIAAAMGRFTGAPAARTASWLRPRAGDPPSR